MEIAFGREDRGDDSKSRFALSPGGIEQILSLTTPFGRPYYIESAGFQRYSFDLFPWMGKKIRTQTDFEVEPSILLRLSADRLNQVEGGVLELVRGSDVIASAKTKEGRAALIVGRSRSIPTTLIDDWKLELLARKTDEYNVALGIQAWKKAVIKPPSVPIVAG